MKTLSVIIVCCFGFVFLMMIYYMADLWAERITFKGNNEVRKCRTCGRFYRRDRDGVWRLTIDFPSRQECHCQKWNNKK